MCSLPIPAVAIMIAATAESGSRCFLCNEASEQVVWRENGYEGRLCRCGTLYTNRKNAPAVADQTEEHHPEEFYSRPAKFKAAWVAKHCHKGRLLEVGCGNG